MPVEIYTLLEVPPQAAVHQIMDVSANPALQDLQKAFQKAVKKWHPDLNKDPHAHDTFILIKWAYQTLRDRIK